MVKHSTKGLIFLQVHILIETHPLLNANGKSPVKNPDFYGKIQIRKMPKSAPKDAYIDLISILLDLKLLGHEL